METLSRKTYIETGGSFPRLFMTVKQLKEYEGMSESYYRQIFREIMDQIAAGRYPAAAMGSDEPRSVNYYVYRDYVSNRKRIKSKNMKKIVQPFNPAEVAAICPLVREVIVMAE